MNTSSDRRVTIEMFNRDKTDHDQESAVVAIDVIRATTTAVTGVALGRRCFPVSSTEEAHSLARILPDPILIGEQRGIMPPGFDLQNSPFQLHARSDIERPMILLSSSGTRLIGSYKNHPDVYVACLRNLTATTTQLLTHHSKVVLIGAGTQGEFREEDQLCCAWIAEAMIGQGYTPGNETTAKIVEQWSGAPVERILEGNSAAYLKRSGQTDDLDFILNHVDDLAGVYRFRNRQVVEQPPLHAFAKVWPKGEEGERPLGSL